MEGNKRARRRRRNGLETLKTVLILLLTLSAVVLTLQVLLFHELTGHTPQSWWKQLTTLFGADRAAPTSGMAEPNQSAPAAQPVRIAVCDGKERLAIQYDAAQADKLFDSVGILLSEALSSATTPQSIPETAWRRALQAPGVWFDFLGAIPLEALYAWMGEGGYNPALSASARQMAVARESDGGVSLYYHNEADGLYYACKTEVTYLGHMDELISGHGGNSTSFAFELGEDSGYAGLESYVLLSPSTPSPLLYRASNPLAAVDDALVDSLQEAVSFQAPSDARYAIPGGLRLRLGRETLEVGNDGTVTYHTSEDKPSRYPIGGGDGYTVPELVESTRALAANTVGHRCGGARLYLMGIDALPDGSTEIRYGYSLNGASVLLPEDGCAARFTVRDGQITDYTLRFRSYEETTEHSLLLPERQAAAALAALSPEGRELALCYTDSGGDTVQAGWVAR